ncbi:MAG: alpha/beta hydrolase [Proteobacteria bacterium]|nr:alpha/beta hydrolase [Pseudomonadota bacterium]
MPARDWVSRHTILAAWATCLALAALGLATRAAERPPGVVSEGPATQMATVQYVFHSANTGRDYLIKVTSPFHPVPAGQQRPVIYALDGGYEVAGPIAWVLGGSGGMPEAFVVSVGYLPADYRWRATDLAFRGYEDDYDKVKVPSGAAAFHAFLTNELRPFIAARLPVDDHRAILFGHSEGALFAANILAAQPREYAGYIIASPAVWSDPTILDRLRAGLPRARDIRVFLAVGGAETPRMRESGQEIAGLLRTNTTIALRTETYPGATHLSYYPALITQAFPWMLDR